MTDVRWFAEVDSTNQVAAEMAAPGLAVVADHQTAGRGRFDRTWSAPPGSSLLVSVVLPLFVRHAGIVVAIAAADACHEVAGVTVALKWPNDLMVGGRKLGGILGLTAGGHQVVGLGLNVNWHAEPPPEGGVALDALAGRVVDRLSLLAAFLRHLAQPPDDLLDTYRRRCTTIGRRVQVQLGSEVIEGQAVGVSPDGHLVLDDDRVVPAGDVTHVRPTS